MADKMRFRRSEAEAIAAVNNFNSKLTEQNPEALGIFKAVRSSKRFHYAIGIPAAREAEFNDGDEEHKYRMALVSMRAMSSGLLMNSDMVSAYEDEYAKEFNT